VSGAALLVDCSSLAYRAYHSVPPLLAPDGREVHAALGLFNFLIRLLEDRQPSVLHVALDDDWRPQFRVDALPTYKTHRLAGEGEPEDTVGVQIAIAAALLEEMGVSVARAPGYEAEDVIASLLPRTPGPVEIVTGDRDLFALVVDPRVRVLYTLQGVTGLAFVDQEWVARKHGIPGDRYLDYALMRGDPSDGLPGVRGIGEKTASALLTKYGSLDAILAARDLSPTIRARFAASAEYLEAARRVVAPVMDCPLSAGSGALPCGPVDAGALLARARAVNLGGSVERLVAALRPRLEG